MQGIANAVQNAAKKLLAENKVELVIGFAKGTLPLRSTPTFIRKPEDAEKLVWGYTCENNLANYLRGREQKVAVVAKGCDSRSIVGLIQENQINRDNLYIIGVPCSGMVDRRKVASLLEGDELLEVEEKDDTLIIKGRQTSKTVKIADVLHKSCADCAHRNPVIYDELIGEPVPEGSGAAYQDIKEFEAKSPSERRNYLVDELSKCIRCYACRNACPMCYCDECFVDCSTPEWISKSATNIQDNLFFQAVRVFHSAGRCVDCSACERACPMGINLGLLTRKLVKDAKELFGTEAGLSLDDKPALSTYKLDDPQPFLVKE